MSIQYKHKRYFRIRSDMADSSQMVTFSSTADANTKIGFKACWNTSSPTVTEALEDSGTTLVKTYEFNSDSDQTAFKNAVDAEYGESSFPWNGTDMQPNLDQSTEGGWSKKDASYVEHFKTEWLHQDGSVSSTENF